MAISNGRVIGQLGLIPVKLKFGNEIYDAQWACDLMVDPEIRKTGIGRKLFEAGMDRDMITLGNNASPAADRLMLAIGFKPIPSGRNMVFPVDAGHILKWITPGKFNFSIPVIRKFVQPYFSFKVNKLSKSKSNFENCKWEEVSDYIIQRQNQNQNPQILHDEEFLKWRASGLANFSPRINAAKLTDGSYVLHSAFNPYYDIYDWHCKSFEDTKNMTALIINQALENMSRTIQVIANEPEEENRLKKLGFIRSRNIERIIHYSKKKLLEKAEKFYFTLYDTDLNL